MKKTMIGLMSALLVLSFAAPALSLEKGNKRKGKYTYRKVYKSCFERGEAATKKPVMNPDAKTQAQWTRVFENGEFDEFGCQQEWAALSEKDLSDIYTYLHDHAADSPTPAKCK